MYFHCIQNLHLGGNMEDINHDCQHVICSFTLCTLTCTYEQLKQNKIYNFKKKSSIQILTSLQN